MHCPPEDVGVLTDPDYKGFRIEVNAVAEGDRWHADVRIRRIAGGEPHVERVLNYSLIPATAELTGLRWARLWIDHDGPLG